MLAVQQPRATIGVERQKGGFVKLRRSLIDVRDQRSQPLGVPLGPVGLVPTVGDAVAVRDEAGVRQLAGPVTA